MRTQTFTGVLEVLDCGECGVTFGLDETYIVERRKDHRTWYCPNGHARHYPQLNVEERLRRELAAAEGAAAAARARAEKAREETAHTKRRLAAAKGQLTKMRKRIAAGVCPCCNRSFKQVRQHMERQHPDEAALVFTNPGKQ